MDKLESFEVDGTEFRRGDTVAVEGRQGCRYKVRALADGDRPHVELIGLQPATVQNKWYFVRPERLKKGA